MGLFNKEYIGSLRWDAIKNKSKNGNGKPQYTYRAKVIGGWLVETENFTGSCGGLTFIPDPEHAWILEDD